MRALVAALVGVVGLSVVAGSAAGAPRVLRNWPCAGCIVQLPAHLSRAHPPPLLVALHGDEGDPTLTAEIWGPVASARGVVLFAPQCPTVLGCRFQNGAGQTNSWWGWLQYSRQYDDAWIEQQVDRVARRYRLDPRRRYLTGWSGGADYLGWYALRHANAFAAAAFVAGGVPYSQTCPSRSLGAYFLLGANDPRYESGQPLQVKSVLDRCGDPTSLTVLPGADHESSIMSLQSGYATKILAWLLTFPRGR